MTWVERMRVGVVAILCVVSLLLYGSDQLLRHDQQFAVHFLDVGQGDAILIQTPEGYEVLIDGGAGSAVISEIAKHQSWNDRTIDVVIATHPDTDHVGGLVDVLGRYEVDLIVRTEAESDSPAAVAFSSAVADEKAAVRFARAGQRIMIGASTTIEILSPASDTTNWSTNAASIVARVTYGDTAFMLSGDAPASVEEYLVSAYGADLKSNVLKLGHHGSKTSTSGLFLDTAQPQYAVVSAGIDNRYGHPDQSVIGRVFSRNIQTFHTGVDGTVTFHSDGKVVYKK